MSPRRSLVVVDGSNLATEGRTLPSLAQLRECVEAFRRDEPSLKPVVIVDATFGHRIAPAERTRFKDAELAGELVTPPAGAIGRGDAFILKIASQSDAVVLSNDSFQEFQQEHTWLFDEGRLIGGKPVPGIGWVFTPRLPVRAPKTRKAAGADVAKAPAPPKAASKAAPAAAPAVEVADPPAARRRGRRAETPVAEPTPPPTTGRGARARKAATKAAAKPPAEAEPRTRRGGATTKGASRPKAATTGSRTTGSTATGSTATGSTAAGSSRQTRQPAAARATKSGRSQKGAAAAPTTAKPAKASGSGAARTSPTTRDDTPVNSTRAFRAMTSRHAERSQVEGDVASFTSHGAMITVTVGRGTHVSCYVPLAGLGRPAPTRARDVLKLGERRTFRVVAYDDVRRIAELALIPTP